ncbi:hypothetical protein ACSBR1_030105 [Camellia fascicularis]
MEYMSVDPEGSAGGLLYIWDPAVFQLSVCCFNRRYILLSGSLYNSFDCVLINIYAPNDISARLTLWADILKLKDHFRALWCMGGDFNEIRHIGERVGCSRRDRGMKHFNEFIGKCELNDLPLHGRKYTWCNAQESEKWSCIDRVLLGPEWLINFRIKLWGLPRLISDHCPLLMIEDERDWGPRPFMFLNAWTLRPSFSKFFVDIWSNTSVTGWAGFILVQKLKHLQLELKKWNVEVFGNVLSKLKVSEEELHALDILAEERPLVQAEMARRRVVRGEMWKLHRMAEWLWHQKSILNWTLNRDKNTRFFHVFANARQSRNMISSIEVNGVSYEDPNRVKFEVNQHFKKQFAEDWPKRLVLEGVFKTIEADYTSYLLGIIAVIFTIFMWIIAKLKWCGNSCLKIVFSLIFNLSTDKDGSLHQFFARKTSPNNWNFPIRRVLFSWELDEETSLLCIANTGEFSVSTLYSFSNSIIGPHFSICKHIWNRAVPPKVSFFCWLAWKNKIKSAKFMHRIGILDPTVSTSCTFCSYESESTIHVLLHCPFSWLIWSFIIHDWGLS